MAEPSFSALPAGTVTFLLTDVEGSTSLWETRRSEIEAAVATHYEILDRAVAAAGGVRPIEQGEGDTVVAAFVSAADALRAALAAQLRLRAEFDWLPVRIAVHTGDAQLRDEGNYVGRTIIRCARLRSIGHGGQILVSETTAALTLDGLPDGASLVDLGVARLRDLSRPERVWQLSHPDLPDTYPALLALDATPNNLPSAMTSFIGREADLITIATLVRNSRIVTLTGSGGCGKTRLAQHVAAELVEVHPGGVWWVELAAVSSDAQVADRLAVAVGLAASPAVNVEQAIVAHLRGAGAVLVVIDNAEQVLDAVAGVVAAIVNGCPEAKVLVTSREPLGVPGETVWRVPSLGLPRVDEPMTAAGLAGCAAARLFLERARQARPNLVVDDRTAPFIVAICARLDGIPLALELAAARARAMPLDRLAAGLHDAFRLLTGGARTGLARQQTLLASIAWSVDLLEDTERAVLRRLAVFHGSFPLDAAEAVAADDDLVDAFVVLDVIGRLVDKSLVQLDDDTDRYRLLETIRQFALERLSDADELADAKQRHCRWFADWSEDAGRGKFGVTFGPTDEVIPDVLAALNWAYEYAPSAAYRISRGLGWIRPNFGHFAEFQRQYDWLAGRDGSDDPTGWAAAVAGLAYAARVSLRFDYPALAARAAPLLDPDDRAGSRLMRMFQLAVDSNIRADSSGLEQGLDEAIEDGDDLALRQYAGALAVHDTRRGHFDRARRDVAAVTSMLTRRGLPFTLGTGQSAFGNLIYVLYEEGRLREAAGLATTAGPTDAVSATITAASAAMVGYLMADDELVEQALSLHDGEVPGIMRAASSLVVHYAALHRREPAVASEGIVECYLGFPMTPALKSFVLRPLVVSLLRSGLRDHVDQYLDPFVVDVDRIGRPPLPVAHLHQIHALLARADGRDDEWAEHAHSLLGVASHAGYVLLTIDALELLAELADRRGSLRTAARLFGAATGRREEIGYVPRIAPDPEVVDAVVELLRSAEPAAFAEGDSLGLDEAVEFAQRSRGERGRPTHGWGSLTPTEQRVAALVADGLPNDQVAARLLMSPATVKTHLTHIFVKTGITNRTELARNYRIA